MMRRSREWWADAVLRAGVAFAFLYPPISALSSLESWIGYFPPFMRGIVPDATLLHTFGVVEVIIALWILSGKRIFWPSMAGAAMLVGIVVFNMNNFEVIFRDLAIAAGALALAITHGSRRAES